MPICFGRLITGVISIGVTKGPRIPPMPAKCLAVRRPVTLDGTFSYCLIYGSILESIPVSRRFIGRIQIACRGPKFYRETDRE
jgi:hypothetical protein